MAFNVAKCHIMHLGTHNLGHVYHMGGTRLKVTDSERDVGVLVSSNLKPSQQCKKAAQTASALLQHRSPVPSTSGTSMCSRACTSNMSGHI